MGDILTPVPDLVRGGRDDCFHDGRRDEGQGDRRDQCHQVEQTQGASPRLPRWFRCVCHLLLPPYSHDSDLDRLDW
jgi:hypothetical protein